MKHRRCIHLSLCCGFYLLLGAFGVVAVASVIASRSPSAQGTYVTEWIPWGTGLVHARFPHGAYGSSRQHRSTGTGWFAEHASSTDQPVLGAGSYMVMVKSTGWPLLALTGAVHTTTEAPGSPQLHHAIAISQTFGARQTTVWPFLPTKPIWPAFAIDVMLYAAVLATVVHGPAALRRHVRRKRGRCSSCGYRLVDAARCPECGAIERAHA